MKTVVVPIDETELSERAVPVAGALAAATGAEIALMVVNSPKVEPGADVAYLESWQEQLPDGVASRRVLALVDDDVDQAVVEEATGAPESLIVMATHARSGPGTLLLGSVADGVLRRSPVPVVLVGPQCHAADVAFERPLVVAVDGTALDHVLTDAAEEWARSTGADVAVVHCRIPVAVEGVVGWTGDDDAAARAAARLRDAGITATSRSAEAATAAVGVLDEAARVAASAVMVGTRRPGRLERALLGSTAAGIAHRAPCPVVAVGGSLDAV